MPPVREWAENERSNDWHRDDREQSSINILEGVLQGNVTPEDAAGSLTALYEPSIRRDTKGLDVCDLWGVFCSAVKTLGGRSHARDRLIALLTEISQLECTDNRGRAVSHNVEEYWSDLPLFLTVFSESTRNEEGEDTDEEDENYYSHEHAAALLNNASFAAVCTAQGLFGMEYYCTKALRDGLEPPLETPGDLRGVRMYVPPAAACISFAGETLYRLCQDEHRHAEQISGPKPYLWHCGHDDSGHSLDRWTLWKEKFGEVSGMENLESGVRDVAMTAMEEMERVVRDVSSKAHHISSSDQGHQHGRLWKLFHRREEDA